MTWDIKGEHEDVVSRRKVNKDRLDVDTSQPPIIRGRNTFITDSPSFDRKLGNGTKTGPVRTKNAIRGSNNNGEVATIGAM